jgi:CRISPR-associated protein Cas6
MSNASPVADVNSELPTVLDLAFPLVGQKVPEDSGYLLYAAICDAVPSAHGAGWLAVHSLRGQLISGVLHLPRRAALTLRVEASRMPQLLVLSGRRLQVGGFSLVLGSPWVRPLSPSASLKSPIVVIRMTRVAREADHTIDKLAMAQAFKEELQRQLTTLGVTAQSELIGRRQIRVGGKRVIGWAVRLYGLSPAGSLRVQMNGLGGKHGMGCGVFVPTRDGNDVS